MFMLLFLCPNLFSVKHTFGRTCFLLSGGFVKTVFNTLLDTLLANLFSKLFFKSVFEKGSIFEEKV